MTKGKLVKLMKKKKYKGNWRITILITAFLPSLSLSSWNFGQKKTTTTTPSDCLTL